MTKAKKTAKISLEDLAVAISVLGTATGHPKEVQACHAVSQWLVSEVKKRRQDGARRTVHTAPKGASVAT
jgi:hypothetical protein